jgi:ribosomal protein L18E
VISLITALLSGGVVAALVSAHFRQKEAREAQIFATKFDTYKKFASDLLSAYGELTNEYWKSRLENGVFSYPNADALNARSAKILLVATSEIFQKIKEFNELASQSTIDRWFADNSVKKYKNIYSKIYSKMSIEEIHRKLAILTANVEGGLYTTEEDMIRAWRERREAGEKLKEAGNEIMTLMR